MRRAVAFDVDRQAGLLRRVLGSRDQFEIILQRLDRRHEHAEPAVARLDRKRGAHRAADLAKLLLDALLLAGRGGEGGGRLPPRHLVGAFGFGRSRLRQDLFARRQRPARHRRIDRHDVGILRRRHIGQRCRAAGGSRPANRPAPGTAGRDASAIFPSASAEPEPPGVPALDRQHIARRFRQPALEHTRHAAALFRVFELRVRGIDIVGQLAFLEQPFGRVLIGFGDHAGIDAEFAGDRRQQPLGVLRPGLAVGFLAARSGPGSHQTGSPSARQ